MYIVNIIKRPCGRIGLVNYSINIRGIGGWLYRAIIDKSISVCKRPQGYKALGIGPIGLKSAKRPQRHFTAYSRVALVVVELDRKRQRTLELTLPKGVRNACVWM